MIIKILLFFLIMFIWNWILDLKNHSNKTEILVEKIDLPVYPKLRGGIDMVA